MDLWCQGTYLLKNRSSESIARSFMKLTKHIGDLYNFLYTHIQLWIKAQNTYFVCLQSLGFLRPALKRCTCWHLAEARGIRKGIQTLVADFFYLGNDVIRTKEPLFLFVLIMRSFHNMIWNIDPLRAINYRVHLVNEARTRDIKE